MAVQESLTFTLKNAGMRITPQRIAICTMLAESKEHPTAAMIYESIKQSYPSLSLATVYNTLDALVAEGAVNALGNAGDDKVHYDADTGPHIHLACIQCHSIIDIPSDLVSQMEKEVSGSSGYRLLGARVVYYGVCPTCQQTKQPENHPSKS